MATQRSPLELSAMDVNALDVCCPMMVATNHHIYQAFEMWQVQLRNLIFNYVNFK